MLQNHKSTHSQTPLFERWVNRRNVQPAMVHSLSTSAVCFYSPLPTLHSTTPCANFLLPAFINAPVCLAASAWKTTEAGVWLLINFSVAWGESYSFIRSEAAESNGSCWPLQPVCPSSTQNGWIDPRWRRKDQTNGITNRKEFNSEPNVFGASSPSVSNNNSEIWFVRSSLLQNYRETNSGMTSGYGI
jgi:hypothetical protein